MAVGGAPLDNRFRKANPGFGGPNYSPENAFAQSIPTQGEDYDEIMQGYQNLMGGGNDPYGGLISKYESELNSGNNQYKPVSYTEAPEWQQAYAKAQEYANTGGLSDSEQGNLRARAVSPIRSMYANMTRNMDRQKRLAGGFSPNYNASAARMAREGSEQIAGQVTNANAAIAEMVQKGRLAMTPEMAKLAAGKNSLMNEVNLQNAANQTKANDNRGNLLSGMNQAITGQQGNKIDALRGMTSLYGTNPGLVETYGNITQNQQNINNNAANNSARNRSAGMGRALSGYGR